MVAQEEVYSVDLVTMEDFEKMELVILIGRNRAGGNSSASHIRSVRV